MKDDLKQNNNPISLEEEKDRINFIKSGTGSNHLWVNGKSGCFKDFDNNCLYRFCETDKNYNAYLLKEGEQKKLPVLACGFVAWLIKHWGTDTQTIYSEYLQARLNQYKAEHKNDIDVFNRNLEREFYDQYRAKEEQWVKQSEAIFDFISESEVNRIKKYVQYYFAYVDSKAKTTQLKAAADEIPRYTLTPDVVDVIKKQILPIWKSDVLKNTLDDVFIEAIATANFSAYYQKKQRQKVGQFIYSLKKIMGDAWASDVISKLNDSSASLSKFQAHQPINTLKLAMQGITVVNSAGNQFKVDTKTQYTDKSGKPYFKATK